MLNLFRAPISLLPCFISDHYTVGKLCKTLTNAAFLVHMRRLDSNLLQNNHHFESCWLILPTQFFIWMLPVKTLIALLLYRVVKTSSLAIGRAEKNVFYLIYEKVKNEMLYITEWRIPQYTTNWKDLERCGAMFCVILQNSYQYLTCVMTIWGK